MRTAEFDYDLPTEAIAQTPLDDRASARLLVDNGAGRSPSHEKVSDLPTHLEAGDVLVVNNTRVRRARLLLEKDTGGSVEVLLVDRRHDGTWEALVRPSRRVRSGTVLHKDQLSVAIDDDLGDGRRLVRVETTGAVRSDAEPEGGMLDDAVEAAIEAAGVVPLPPYIHEQVSDPDRYQTVFATRPGSSAAPTAGLHLTPEVLDACRARGVTVADIDLEIGLDTFRPITGDEVERHRIHSETYRVPAETLQICQESSRVVAVGTTVVRALETAAVTGRLEGRTDLFIARGYRFGLVDRLLTNFHFPRSTLLVLVDAFVGQRWRSLYDTALADGYRFLSFGDAMLLDRMP